MDIAALSSAMSQSNLAQKVSLSVAKLSMDTAKESGQKMTKMIEASIDPNVGKFLDVRA